MVRVVTTKSFVNEEKRVVTVLIFDDFKNQWVGQARCSEADTFDKDFGEKLAYLRAKRKMLKYYKRENAVLLEQTLKNLASYKERMAKEINKHQNAIDKTNEVISEMLNNI